MTDAQVRRHLKHSILVEGHPDQVLQTLTPEGERAWVPDWAPEYIEGHAGELATGQVFVTRHGGETTLWMVQDVHLERRRISYHRFTPGSRVGLVTVTCDEVAVGRTRVGVSYEMIGLSEEGDAAIREAERGFADAIDAWKPAIEAVLGGSGDRTPA